MKIDEFCLRFYWSLFLSMLRVQSTIFQDFVQIMTWCRSGDKPLSEPMLVFALTHICVTRPQWVKSIGIPSIKNTGGLSTTILTLIHTFELKQHPIRVNSSLPTTVYQGLIYPLNLIKWMSDSPRHFLSRPRKNPSLHVLHTFPWHFLQFFESQPNPIGNQI